MEIILLLQITTQCLEGCSHCMANASPEGEHMTDEIFQASFNFIRRIKTMNVQVTGGEPTLHPDFFNICKRLCEIRVEAEMGMAVILDTNGSFIHDPEKTEQVKELVQNWDCLIQVRTHPKYYPNYKEIIHNEKLKKITPYIFDDAINLIPFGRALENHKDLINWSAKPSCSNMFLLSRQVHSLVSIIHNMEANGFYCKPMIATTGRVHVGETVTCRKIGTVWDSNDKIFTNLRQKKPCDKCGLVKNIPQQARSFF